MLEDTELLRRYAREKSEPAFAELVQRHVNFVYAAALRRVGGDAHLAEDVTQHVFMALARSAATLAQHPVLSGWLYTTTRNAAAQAVRGERRRQAREQEAQIMNELTSAPSHEAEWERLRPVLDGAMDELDETDRQAVLLRFFEKKSFGVIGAKLRLNENTARMRVERALDKLHALLGRRGVSSTTGALALTLANQTAVATPAGLASLVTGAALADAGAAGGTIWAALSSMKGVLAIGGAAVLAIIGTVAQRASTTPKEPIAAMSARQPAAEMTVPPRDTTTDMQNVHASNSARVPEQAIARATGIPPSSSEPRPSAAPNKNQNGAGGSAAAGRSALPPARPGPRQHVQLKVLRVFFAQEGDAAFRAYAASWKGQEVVVGDPLVQTNYDVGDTIEALPLSLGSRGGPRLLEFSVVPSFDRGDIRAPFATRSAVSPNSTAPVYEELRLEVLKVFSASDGADDFRAYVVKWKNQEVIVRDLPAKTDHRAGDTIPVWALKSPYPNRRQGPGLVSFSLSPPPPSELVAP